MEAKTLISITTYKKCKALRVLLASLIEHGYNQDIVVADDNCNNIDKEGLTAEQVCREFSDKLNIILMYNEKAGQLGISVNKNRGLKYLFEHPEYSSIIMVDDDIAFHRSGFLEHVGNVHKTHNLHHFAGYWTDESLFESQKLVGLSGRQWSQDFPTIMESEHITWAAGTQGVLIFVTRELALQAGYMRRMKYFYGAEHSEYSTRLNMITGWCPTLFPTLKRCEKWFHGQFIENQYAIDIKKVEENMIQYRELLKDTEMGINLKCDESGLPKKLEVCKKI